jgi:hypothetical protein
MIWSRKKDIEQDGRYVAGRKIWSRNKDIEQE